MAAIFTSVRSSFASIRSVLHKKTQRARRQWSIENLRRGRLVSSPTCPSLPKCFLINTAALKPVFPWRIRDAVDFRTIFQFQWMGWRRAASVLLSRISFASKSPIPIPFANSRPPHFLYSSNHVFRFQCSRPFSPVASTISFTANQFESEFDHSYDFEAEEADEIGKIPIKAYFLCTRFATEWPLD